jgi:Tol biopolymer transport system component
MAIQLEPGMRFGSYEIVGRLGSGGMGEVWRATDTELKRDVALKILPQAFVEDADRLARFQREAETLASLNQANIATIHGIERIDGQTAIVMELVAGPTLAERIAEGPIPPAETMDIAVQIAAALEAAHDRGIVHRDLKPANVIVRADGAVKVLDFGIAKPIGPSAASGTPAATPAVTQTGVILGTASYMSPEQARGKFVDQRTDIWAFGCLLFEMLTGQPAFGGEDVMLTLARVLANDTDLDSIPAAISPAVRHTIKLCLEKDPRKRLHHIGDVRLALAGAFESPIPAAAISGGRAPLRRRAIAPAAALMLGALFAGTAVWLVRAPAPGAIDRFVHPLPDGRPFDRPFYNPIAVSRDGRSFVFDLTDGLHLRNLDAEEDYVIPGTEIDLRTPVFSPDGEWVAFVDDQDRLLRIQTRGGVPQEITAGIGQLSGITWASQDTIYFAARLEDEREGIFSVDANGGSPTLVIESDPGEWLATPQLLPDGDTMVYARLTFEGPGIEGNNFSDAQIVAESLSADDEPVLLIERGMHPHYLPTGHLVYFLEGNLYAVELDPDTLGVSPTSRLVASNVFVASEGAAVAMYAVSDNGTLVYEEDDGPALSTAVIVDRDSNEERLSIPACSCSDPVVSPDGERIAYTQVSDFTGESDIHIWSRERGSQRLTYEAGDQSAALWSPDGQSVVYRSEGEGIVSRLVDGPTDEVTVLLPAEEFVAPMAFAPDDALVYSYDTVDRGREIGILSPDRGAQTLLLGGPEHQQHPSLSPSGDWLLFADDIEQGSRIYASPFPDVDRRIEITDGRGAYPQWSRSDSKVYYAANLMLWEAVIIETESGLAVTSREPLFVIRTYFPGGGFRIRPYAVTDDDRFLFFQRVGASDLNVLHIVQNLLGEP